MSAIVRTVRTAAAERFTSAPPTAALQLRGAAPDGPRPSGERPAGVMPNRFPAAAAFAERPSQ
jgi:hypothetical protein